MTVIEVIEKNRDLSTFYSAISRHHDGVKHVHAKLCGKGQYTIFVPNNAAFNKLNKEEFQQLLENDKNLCAFLQYHVVDGNYGIDACKKSAHLVSHSGEKIYVYRDGDAVYVGNDGYRSRILASYASTNGTINITESILVPLALGAVGAALFGPIGLIGGLALGAAINSNNSTTTSHWFIWIIALIIFFAILFFLFRRNGINCF